MDGPSFLFPNDVHPAWSIMIVLYPYITGLVAGTFVVSSLFFVLGRTAIKPVAQLALVTSFCCCAFATVPLLLHLHHPERCLQVMITPSTTSAMAMFGFVYAACMLVLAVEVWLVFRPAITERAANRGGLVGLFYWFAALGVTNITDRARAVDQWLIRALAITGIPIVCVLTSYVGFLFGAVKSNPWWSTPLLPVIFLVSAIVSGVAAMILLYLFISVRRGVSADVDCIRTLGGYLWLFLFLAVTLEGLELLQMAYDAGDEWEVLSTLLTEHLAVSFGIIQVLVGSLVPLVLLLPAFLRRCPPRLLSFLCGVSSLLVLLQVLAMRWNVVIGGQLFSKSFRGFVEYQPPWMGKEGILAAAAILALPLIAPPAITTSWVSIIS